MKRLSTGWQWGIGAALLLLLCLPTARAQEASRLRQSLELADWTESRFAKFEDGVPLDVDERAEVERLVARLAGFDRRVYRDSPAENVTPAELRDDPVAYRGRYVRLQGELVAAAGSLSPGAPQEGQPPVYLVEAAQNGDRFTAAVATVPQPWREHRLANQRLRVEGIFVRTVAAGEEPPVPLIAAQRIEWYPQQVEPPAVSYGMSVLGNLGIDVGLLDVVEQRRPLEPAETAAFYKLLAGMRSASASQLAQWAGRYLPRHRAEWSERLEDGDAQQRALADEVLRVAESGGYSVAPFFNTPQDQVGQLVVLDGVLRRALRVVTTNDVDAQAAGVDQYYELAVFTDDSQNNPLVFCMLEVPEALPLGNDVHERVQVAGFFFKTWRYRAAGEAAEGAGDEPSYRLAPMFIGRAPLRMVPDEPSSTVPWLIGLAFAGLLAAVWLAVWQAERSDRAFRARTLSRMQRADDAGGLPAATEDSDAPTRE